MPHDPVPGCSLAPLSRWKPNLPARRAFEPEPLPDAEAMAAVLEETARRLGDNYPYFHPLYAGQMLKPPHPVARAAYALAMNINPNNHARDGGRASSQMEIEAVARDRRMFGWTEFLGHLTSSGTFANLEALWVAGQLAPGKTHRRLGAGALHAPADLSSAQAGLRAVPADTAGRMDLDALEAELRKGDVGTVVVTLGTTAMGAVDPLDEILTLRERYGFRVHVDAAYGGYFRLIADALDEPARRAFAAIDQADSIVSTRTSTGCSPMDAAASVSRSRQWGAFTNTIRLIPTSLRRIAPGRDQPGVLARRSGGGGALGDAAACCRSCRMASLREA